METKSIKYTKETFPKKWVVELTDDNLQIVGKWFNENGKTNYNNYHIEGSLPYLAFPGDSSHYYSEKETKEKGHTIITFEDFKEHVLMKKDKKILGYKLKDEAKQYIPAIKNILDSSSLNGSRWWNENAEDNIFKYGYTFAIAPYFKNRNIYSTIKDAGILDVWFEPVYEEKFTYKQGDYLYCKNDFLMTDGRAAYIKGKVYHCSGDESITDEEDHYHLMPIQNYDGFPFTHFFRHATEEEIENSQKKVLTIGTSKIKVEVSKGKIVAEGKTIDADSLSKLVHDMNVSKQYNLPWNVGFGSSVIIGCSSFKQGELNSVLEVYDKINNTSFALLPF